MAVSIASKSNTRTSPKLSSASTFGLSVQYEKQTTSLPDISTINNSSPSSGINMPPPAPITKDNHNNSSFGYLVQKVPEKKSNPTDNRHLKNKEQIVWVGQKSFSVRVSGNYWYAPSVQTLREIAAAAEFEKLKASENTNGKNQTEIKELETKLWSQAREIVKNYYAFNIKDSGIRVTLPMSVDLVDNLAENPQALSHTQKVHLQAVLHGWLARHENDHVTSKETDEAKILQRDQIYLNKNSCEMVLTKDGLKIRLLQDGEKPSILSLEDSQQYLASIRKGTSQVPINSLATSAIALVNSSAPDKSQLTPAELSTQYIQTIVYLKNEHPSQETRKELQSDAKGLLAQMMPRAESVCQIALENLRKQDLDQTTKIATYQLLILLSCGKLTTDTQEKLITCLQNALTVKANSPDNELQIAYAVLSTLQSSISSRLVSSLSYNLVGLIDLIPLTSEMEAAKKQHDTNKIYTIELKANISTKAQQLANSSLVREQKQAELLLRFLLEPEHTQLAYVTTFACLNRMPLSRQNSLLPNILAVNLAAIKDKLGMHPNDFVVENMISQSVDFDPKILTKHQEPYKRFVGGLLLKLGDRVFLPDGDVLSNLDIVQMLRRELSYNPNLLVSLVTDFMNQQGETADEHKIAALRFLPFVLSDTRINQEELFPIILKCLEDASPLVQTEAIIALAYCKSKKDFICEKLEEIKTLARHTPRVKMAAAFALVRLSDKVSAKTTNMNLLLNAVKEAETVEDKTFYLRLIRDSGLRSKEVYECAIGILKDATPKPLKVNHPNSATSKKVPEPSSAFDPARIALYILLSAHSRFLIQEGVIKPLVSYAKSELSDPLRGLEIHEGELLDLTCIETNNNYAQRCSVLLSILQKVPISAIVLLPRLFMFRAKREALESIETRLHRLTQASNTTIDCIVKSDHEHKISLELRRHILESLEPILNNPGSEVFKPSVLALQVRLAEPDSQKTYLESLNTYLSQNTVPEMRAHAINEFSKIEPELIRNSPLQDNLLENILNALESTIPSSLGEKAADMQHRLRASAADCLAKGQFVSKEQKRKIADRLLSCIKKELRKTDSSLIDSEFLALALRALEPTIEAIKDYLIPELLSLSPQILKLPPKVKATWLGVLGNMSERGDYLTINTIAHTLMSRSPDDITTVYPQAVASLIQQGEIGQRRLIQLINDALPEHEADLINTWARVQNIPSHSGLDFLTFMAPRVAREDTRGSSLTPSIYISLIQREDKSARAQHYAIAAAGALRFFRSSEDPAVVAEIKSCLSNTVNSELEDEYSDEVRVSAASSLLEFDPNNVEALRLLQNAVTNDAIEDPDLKTYAACGILAAKEIDPVAIQFLGMDLKQHRYPNRLKQVFDTFASFKKQNFTLMTLALTVITASSSTDRSNRGLCLSAYHYLNSLGDLSPHSFVSPNDTWAGRVLDILSKHLQKALETSSSSELVEASRFAANLMKNDETFSQNENRFKQILESRLEKQDSSTSKETLSILESLSILSH